MRQQRAIADIATKAAQHGKFDCFTLIFFSLFVTLWYCLIVRTQLFICLMFIKLPGPGDSERTFWSSSHAATCPSVLPHLVEASHYPF